MNISLFFGQKMEQELQEKKTYNHAVKLLSKQDYSIYKLTQKLLTKGYQREHIDTVIVKLSNQNYIREKEYTLSRVKSLLYRGYANGYIEKKLETEFLDVNTELIDAVRMELSLTSTIQLENLIDKKLKICKKISTDNDKLKLKQKLFSYLSTKGYSYEDINEQLEKRL